MIPEDKKENTNNNVSKSVRSKERFNRADKIQIGMLILNLFTLGAFIWISSVQISKTNDALNIADTSNKITREALEFTKEANLSSDSSTKESIRIADSTMKIALENFRTLRGNNQIELRGYPTIDSVYFFRLKVGERPIIAVRVLNSGLTPIYNILYRATIEFSDVEPFINEYVNSRGIVGGGRHNITYNWLDFIITKSDSVNIVSGETFVTFSLKINYQDIFSKKDSLAFNFFYIPKMKMWGEFIKEEDKEYYKELRNNF